MSRRICTLVIAVFVFLNVSFEYQPAGATVDVDAAISSAVQSLGYELTNRKWSSDPEVVRLEQRDSEAYQPSTRTVYRLRSLEPWPRSPSVYYRYWLFRETYDSEERAEKRIREYLTNYTERLETPTMSRHMISKTILRVGGQRRGATVYLLVTDGAYTYFDDKKQKAILPALVKLKSLVTLMEK